MRDIISEIPFLLKIALCMYIIPAGLNAMYEIGYMFGECIRTFVK